MWKYILATFFIVMGSFEIILSRNERLREVIMQNSLVRSRRAEPLVLLLAGLSGVVTGIGIIVYSLLQ